MQQAVEKREFNSILIHNLPEGTSKEEVFKKFKKFGHIKSTQIFKRKHPTIKIEYEKAEDAAKAKDEMNFHTIRGQEINIQFFLDKDWKNDIKHNNIVIKNIPAQVSQIELEEAFNKYGEVFSLFLKKGHDKANLGIGYVQFFKNADKVKILESQVQQGGEFTITLSDNRLIKLKLEEFYSKNEEEAILQSKLNAFTSPSNGGISSQGEEAHQSGNTANQQSGSQANSANSSAQGGAYSTPQSGAPIASQESQAVQQIETNPSSTQAQQQTGEQQTNSVEYVVIFIKNFSVVDVNTSESTDIIQQQKNIEQSMKQLVENIQNELHDNSPKLEFYVQYNAQKKNFWSHLFGVGTHEVFKSILEIVQRELKQQYPSCEVSFKQKKKQQEPSAKHLICFGVRPAITHEKVKEWLDDEAFKELTTSSISFNLVKKKENVASSSSSTSSQASRNFEKDSQVLYIFFLNEEEGNLFMEICKKNQTHTNVIFYKPKISQFLTDKQRQELKNKASYHHSHHNGYHSHYHYSHSSHNGYGNNHHGYNNHHHGHHKNNYNNNSNSNNYHNNHHHHNNSYPQSHNNHYGGNFNKNQSNNATSNYSHHSQGNNSNYHHNSHQGTSGYNSGKNQNSNNNNTHYQNHSHPHNGNNNNNNNNNGNNNYQYNKNKQSNTNNRGNQSGNNQTTKSSSSINNNTNNYQNNNNNSKNNGSSNQNNYYQNNSNQQNNTNQGGQRYSTNSAPRQSGNSGNNSQTNFSQNNQNANSSAASSSQSKNYHGQNDSSRQNNRRNQNNNSTGSGNNYSSNNNQNISPQQNLKPNNSNPSSSSSYVQKTSQNNNSNNKQVNIQPSNLASGVSNQIFNGYSNQQSNKGASTTSNNSASANQNSQSGQSNRSATNNYNNSGNYTLNAQASGVQQQQQLQYQAVGSNYFPNTGKSSQGYYANHQSNIIAPASGNAGQPLNVSAQSSLVSNLNSLLIAISTNGNNPQVQLQFIENLKAEILNNKMEFKSVQDKELKQKVITIIVRQMILNFASSEDRIGQVLQIKEPNSVKIKINNYISLNEQISSIFASNEVFEIDEVLQVMEDPNKFIQKCELITKLKTS